MNKKWYALYTKTGQEQKVTAALAKKGMETYCPVTGDEIVSGIFKKKISRKPVFSSFVFVRITEKEMNLVRQTPDVINFIFWFGRPAVIEENDIQSIRVFTGSHHTVTVEKTAMVKNASSLLINMPSETELHNKTEGCEKMLLPSLGYILLAKTALASGSENYDYKTGKMF